MALGMVSVATIMGTAHLYNSLTGNTAKLASLLWIALDWTHTSRQHLQGKTVVLINYNSHNLKSQ